MPRAPLLIALVAAIACQDPVSPAPVVATGSPVMARSAPEPRFNGDVAPRKMEGVGDTSRRVEDEGKKVQRPVGA